MPSLSSLDTPSVEAPSLLDLEMQKVSSEGVSKLHTQLFDENGKWTKYRKKIDTINSVHTYQNLIGLLGGGTAGLLGSFLGLGPFAYMAVTMVGSFVSKGLVALARGRGGLSTLSYDIKGLFGGVTLKNKRLVQEAECKTVFRKYQKDVIALEAQKGEGTTIEPHFKEEYLRARDLEYLAKIEHALIHKSGKIEDQHKKFRNFRNTTSSVVATGASIAASSASVYIGYLAVAAFGLAGPLGLGFLGVAVAASLVGMSTYKLVKPSLKSLIGRLYSRNFKASNEMRKRIKSELLKVREAENKICKGEKVDLSSIIGYSERQKSLSSRGVDALQSFQKSTAIPSSRLIPDEKQTTSKNQLDASKRATRSLH